MMMEGGGYYRTQRWSSTTPLCIYIYSSVALYISPLFGLPGGLFFLFFRYSTLTLLFCDSELAWGFRVSVCGY